MCRARKRGMSKLSGILINVNGRKNQHEKNSNSTHKTSGMLFPFNCFFIYFECRDCFRDVDNEAQPEQLFARRSILN